MTDNEALDEARRVEREAECLYLDVTRELRDMQASLAQAKRAYNLAQKLAMRSFVSQVIRPSMGYDISKLFSKN